MTTLSDEKANTLNKIIEMNRGAKSFCLARFHRYSYDPKEEQEEITIEVKLESDSGDKLEINARGELTEAVDEAYSRYSRFVGRNPEFDPNKTIEHKPEPLDDKIPY